MRLRETISLPLHITERLIENGWSGVDNKYSVNVVNDTGHRDGSNIKMPFYQYMFSHYKLKTVPWPFYLYNGNSYTWTGNLCIFDAPWHMQHQNIPDRAITCTNDNAQPRYYRCGKNTLLNKRISVQKWRLVKGIYYNSIKVFQLKSGSYQRPTEFIYMNMLQVRCQKF